MATDELDRQRAIRVIRSLIRLADSTTFPAEATSARRKAGHLMARYKLHYEEDVVERKIPVPPIPQAPAPVPVSVSYTSVTATFGFGNPGGGFVIRFVRY